MNRWKAVVGGVVISGMLISFTFEDEKVEASDLDFYCGDSYRAPVSKRKVNPIMLRIDGVDEPVQITSETICEMDPEVSGAVPDGAVFTFNTAKKASGRFYYVSLDGDNILIHYRNAGDIDWLDYCQIEVHGDHVHLHRTVKLEN